MPPICVDTSRKSAVIYYLILTLVAKGSKGIIPEASQEGSLKALKSYNDVAMFHYSVPKELIRATWQFAAFMDHVDCPHREVHIYLKWGSYPVISANDAKFPSQMISHDNETIVVNTITSYEPRTATIVPINSPKPGDWFVGAYLTHWDEKVQQEGLGHKCQYSIGSVAVWSQVNEIQSIPIGYQLTMTTKETMSYYKIFIPSGTWRFQVYIWGCTFTVKTRNSHKICIQNLALQGRVLPVQDSLHQYSIGNLTVMDSYEFVELSPNEDSYYYLLIKSNSIIKFKVKVTTFECPIKSTENSLARHFEEDVPDSIGQVNLTRVHQEETNIYTMSAPNSLDNSDSAKTSNNKKNFIGQDYLDKCIPRYQLTRVKHAQTFSSAYLLQGREWLTSWIALTDLNPILVQFDILPLVDIGGTLDINVHLEMDKILTKQLVIVTLCVKHGVVPKRVEGQIICSSNNLFMNLSSYDKQDGQLLIPYPQSDTWHIGLQAKCFFNDIPVSCEMEEILVSLDIKTRQCVFSGANPCGDHGVCREIHKGLLYYTTCECFKGYRGWGCTDGSFANPHESPLVTAMLLILSNIFFLPAIYLAVKRALYTEGLVYLATMVFSSLYHACDQQFVMYCLAKYEVLQYSDFFSSILAFWVTLVAIAELPPKLASVCHMFGALMIALSVESHKTGLSSFLVPLGIGTFLPILSYCYRCCKLNKVILPDGFKSLLSGLFLACSGLALFCLVETEDNYPYVHSVWHMVIALSLIFLLPSMKDTLNSSNKNMPSETSSELIDYTSSPEVPVFTVIVNNNN